MVTDYWGSAEHTLGTTGVDSAKVAERTSTMIIAPVGQVHQRRMQTQ
jgi:hypothetical protein